jgi:hypothetical protein
VEREGLDDDRDGRRALAFAGPQGADDEAEADEEHQKPNGRQDPLHEGPARLIAARTLFGRAERLRLRPFEALPCHLRLPVDLDAR